MHERHDMTEPETRTCTDCGGTMAEIRLIDKGQGMTTQEVEYGVVGAKASFWSGKVPVAGTVRGFMCADCGLIKHYGVPKQ